MTNTQKIERKKYRDTFLIYVLLGVVGIAAGVYVFKYTDLLSGAAAEYSYSCRMDLRELMERYYHELRFLVVLFLVGFTVFASPCAIVFSLARGFVCAAGILRLFSENASGGADLPRVVMISASVACMFVLELIMASKSARAGAHLQTIVPRPGELVRDPYVRSYALTFALLCAFLLACVSLIYLAPLLPF